MPENDMNERNIGFRNGLPGTATRTAAAPAAPAAPAAAETTYLARVRITVDQLVATWEAA